MYRDYQRQKDTAKVPEPPRDFLMFGIPMFAIMFFEIIVIIWTLPR